MKISLLIRDLAPMGTIMGMSHFLREWFSSHFGLVSFPVHVLASFLRPWGVLPPCLFLPWTSADLMPPASSELYRDLLKTLGVQGWPDAATAKRSLQTCGSSLFMADEIHLWPFLNLIGLGWPLRLYGVFSGVSHQCFLEQHWSTTGTIWWCLVCSFFNWHRRGLLHTADIYSCLAPVFSPDSNIPVFWKEWWNMWNSCFRFSLPWPHLSPPGPPCHKEENGQGCLSTGGVVCGGASRCCC